MEDWEGYVTLKVYLVSSPLIKITGTLKNPIKVREAGYIALESNPPQRYIATLRLKLLPLVCFSQMYMCTRAKHFHIVETVMTVEIFLRII
jgi:hypothetical protein